MCSRPRGDPQELRECKFQSRHGCSSWKGNSMHNALARLLKQRTVEALHTDHKRLPRCKHKPPEELAHNTSIHQPACQPTVARQFCTATNHSFAIAICRAYTKWETGVGSKMTCRYESRVERVTQGWNRPASLRSSAFPPWLLGHKLAGVVFSQTKDSSLTQIFT